MIKSYLKKNWTELILFRILENYIPKLMKFKPHAKGQCNNNWGGSIKTRKGNP